MLVQPQEGPEELHEVYEDWAGAAFKYTCKWSGILKADFKPQHDWILVVAFVCIVLLETCIKG